MPRLFIMALLVCTAACSTTSKSKLEVYSREAAKMGTVFQVTALDPRQADAEKAVEAAFAEIDRIEALISSWDPQSQTSAINRQAGQQPVQVDRELYELIRRSKKVSELTRGIFDISYASMDAVWKFDGSMTDIPSEAEIARSVELIGYEHIILDDERSTVFLQREGMKIGFGAIGKGYAANRCKALMQEMGINNGVVNAGGDLVSWGKQAGGDDWTIGIANPALEESAISWLSVNDMAVVTSGNYERYVEIDGKRFSHIIDPRTGWPAEALKSVTIICPDAELADALATSVFIMGIEDGIAFVNNLKNVECLIIDQEDQLHHSEMISLNYYEGQNSQQSAE
jgi:thiamine biosynthesis lipoprotein